MDNLTPVGYLDISERKRTGSHYTPTNFSDFVASRIYSSLTPHTDINNISIADPALGDGELLYSLSRILNEKGLKVRADGFDIDLAAVESARKRIGKLSEVEQNILHGDFIDYVLSHKINTLFEQQMPLYDAVIANPPYVRTQVLGAEKSQQIAKQFSLKGRVDLYHAFILGIASILKPGGILGIIVSNRFMTTKSGQSVRKHILETFDVLHIWDLGDTQVFEAAVLPAVLLLKKKGKNQIEQKPKFTSIYTIKDDGSSIDADNLFDILDRDINVKIGNKGAFSIKQGVLNNGGMGNGVWRLSNSYVDDWIQKVDTHTYMKFSDIGKIKVGVKTTADDVFIRDDWEKFSFEDRPELLKMLSTHHIARRFKPNIDQLTRKILYPHEVVGGKRQAVRLEKYPKAASYLLKYKDILEGRKYVIEAGRMWYEIWVPHSPEIWDKPKIVFRDISDKPTFWLDLDGSVVNGDCYWFISENNNLDYLWLALAVSNSDFIEYFYDRKFNNKLYSGRRRFISQYVEHFPLPDPTKPTSQQIVSLVKKIYDLIPNQDTKKEEDILNNLVWTAFGFSLKEVSL